MQDLQMATANKTSLLYTDAGLHTCLLACAVVCKNCWTRFCSTCPQKTVLLCSLELQQAKKECVANCCCGLRHDYATKSASTDAMLWSAKGPWTDCRPGVYPLDEKESKESKEQGEQGDETSACSCSLQLQRSAVWHSKPKSWLTCNKVLETLQPMRTTRYHPLHATSQLLA